MDDKKCGSSKPAFVTGEVVPSEVVLVGKKKVGAQRSVLHVSAGDDELNEEIATLAKTFANRKEEADGTPRS